MAGSRREKFIPLLERATGLIKTGTVKATDIPLWYNIYKAFPPQVVPDYNRTLPNIKVGQILYPEDSHRAYFNYHDLSRRCLINMYKSNEENLHSKFLKEVKKLEESHVNVNKNELHQLAIKNLSENLKSVNKK